MPMMTDECPTCGFTMERRVVDGELLRRCNNLGCLFADMWIDEDGSALTNDPDRRRILGRKKP